VQVFKILSFEGYRTAQHGIQKHTQGPYVHEESLIALIYYDFRCEICRSTTLLLNHLAFLYDLGDTEVTYLNALLAVKQDIVELNVSMYYRSAVNMCQGIGYLFEDEFCIRFLKSPLALDKSEEVPTASIFHDH